MLGGRESKNLLRNFVDIRSCLQKPSEEGRKSKFLLMKFIDQALSSLSISNI